MPFCRACGSREPQGTIFCGSCGQPIEPPSVTSPGTSSALTDATTLTSAEEARLAQISRQATQIKPRTQPGESAVPVKGVAFEPITPLLPNGQVPASSQIPAVSGAPRITSVPTGSGAPQIQSPAGTPSMPNPAQPGNVASSGQSASVTQPGGPHGPAQPGNVAGSPHAPVRSGHAVQHAIHSPASPGEPSHIPVQTPAKEIPHRRGWRWRLNHGAQAAGHTTSTAGTAGTAAGVGIAVKAIVAIAVASAAVVGGIKVAPHFFHPGNTQTGVTTQAVPPTQTSCPAAGTARAMVSAPLAPGHQQDLIFSTGTKLERYDSSTGRTTSILQVKNGLIGDAQLSADGAWILLVDEVNGQDAVQMVRVDGQGQQTLHCAPAGQSIINLAWSPDQQSVAFDEGVNIVGGDKGSGAANTELLQLKTGKFQTLLIQPARNPSSIAESLGYLPSYWTDNTHLILQNYIRCCVGDTPPVTLYQLDTTRGANQHPADLQKGAYIRDGGIQGMALSADYHTLFLSDCVCGFNTWRGPSPITEQSSGASGGSRTIYTDAKNAITAIAAIDANNFLIVLGNTEGDLSQNGLWRLNVASGQKTRLMANPANASVSIGFGGIAAWNNVSRDGSRYAIHVVQYTDNNAHITTSLYAGSLQGSAPVKIYAGAMVDLTNEAPQAEAFIVGWTTM